MPKQENDTAYIGARISKEDHWALKKALANKHEKLQDALVSALNSYLNIDINKKY